MVLFIDEKLQVAIATFDGDDMESGRKAIFAIYTLDQKLPR